MLETKKWLRGLAALAMVAGVAAPAAATTLIRQSLEDLVAGNSTIVVGEVVDVNSYWNAEATFILTDVRVAARDVLKGRLESKEFTITLMGGTVGDLTTLIVGGAELVPGSSYVLFLNRENLPGAQRVRTVRDHIQGAFDIVLGKDGLRAISQANRHPLVPDKRGIAEPPGGAEGLPLGTMMQSIREIASRPQGARREVK